MRVIKVDLNRLKYNSTPLVACIGYFDGLHKGHQELLKETVRLGEEMNCETAIITFEPDPWVVIKGDTNVQHISTMRQRINMSIKLGMHNIVLLQFTKEMSELSPADFLEKILGSLNIKALVCGFDFHFAYKGSGDIAFLKEHAKFPIYVIDEFDDEIGKISSTRISQCIQEGKMEEATAMLGYHFTIEGKVIHGKHRGTSMGFPTANVELDPEYIIPKIGVYAGLTFVNGKQYQCMINIGKNPTFKDVNHLSLEVNLIGFEGNLYGKQLKVEFVKFIRGEKTFKNVDNLIMQLEQDLHSIKEYFYYHE